MSAMPSQITSLMIVYSTIYSGADWRKHQSSASFDFAVTGEFPAQRADNAENVSIWWRYHGNSSLTNPGINIDVRSTGPSSEFRVSNSPLKIIDIQMFFTIMEQDLNFIESTWNLLKWKITGISTFGTPCDGFPPQHLIRSDMQYKIVYYDLVIFSGDPDFCAEEEAVIVEKLISLSKLWQLQLLESICVNIQNEEPCLNPSIVDTHTTGIGERLVRDFLLTKKYADVSFHVEGI